MPQVLKEEIRARIESAALAEFYKHGFKFTTMKSIASRAGIPTGLIYSYYKNKADLFAHIVKPVCLFMEAIMSHHPEHGQNHLFDYELPQMMNCINAYHKQVTILFDKSQGSAYAGVKHQMIEDIAAHLRSETVLKNTQFDPIFYHILANNFLENILEISRHYVDAEWAETMLKLVVRQFVYGTHGMGS